MKNLCYNTFSSVSKFGIEDAFSNNTIIQYISSYLSPIKMIPMKTNLNTFLYKTKYIHAHSHHIKETFELYAQ